MLDKRIKTFWISLVTTILFYGYIALMSVIRPQESGINIVITAIVLYGSLMFSLFSLNNTGVHRYSTYRYGLSSTTSKWIVFYIGALLEPEHLLGIFIVGSGFLISVFSDLWMLRSILRHPSGMFTETIKRNKPMLSEETLQEKKGKLSLLTQLVILIAAVSVIAQQTDQVYDVLLHVVFWVFVIRFFKKLDQQDLFPGSLHLVVVYTVLIYVGIVALTHFTDIFTGVFLLLPLCFVMFLPIILVLLKEANIVQKYYDATNVENS